MIRIELRAAALPVLVAVLAAATGDRVVLQNGTGGKSAVIVWGKFSTGETRKDFEFATASQPVGEVDHASADEVAAFTAGRAPAVKKTPWTAAAETRPVDFPSVVELAVKVWVICPNSTCGPLTSAKKTSFKRELAGTNLLFQTERAGIKLKLNSPVLFEDLVGNPAVKSFQDFTVASCDHLLDLVKGRIDHDALNLYMVMRVNGAPSSGHTCGKPNVAVIGYAANSALIAHEIGHNHSLDHVNGDPEFAALGTRNIMWEPSANRSFLSEGEIYRMHLDFRSVLNQASMTSYSHPLAPRAEARYCTKAVSTTEPCPELSYRPFPD